MKKFLLTLALAGVGLHASAVKHGLYVTDAGSFGYAELSANNLSDGNAGVSTSGGLYFHESINVGYMFPHFGFFTGIGLYSTEWNATNTDYHPTLKTDVTQNYVTIPVFFQVITGKNQQIGFYTDFGFRFAFLSSLTADTKFGNGASDRSHDKTGFNDVAVFGTLSAGLKFPLGSRVQLHVGPDLAYQFNNNFDMGRTTGEHLNVGVKLTLAVRCTK